MVNFDDVRVVLPPERLPTHWLNLLPDLPAKLPPLLNPQDLKPAPFEMVTRIFPTECVKQEVSQDPKIEIPADLRKILVALGRPTPLQRAYGFENLIGVKGDDVRIYYKCEYVSPTGSHKLNTAVVQAYYAKKEGFKELVTETGAGQWGSALSLGCRMNGLKCTVYMARGSYQQKPGRRILMETYGSTVYPSPSDKTDVGRKFYEKDPNHPGSLGIAISEALEHTLRDPSIRYSLGSVVNFVLLHQTVIGLEAKEQLASLGLYPDVVIGSIGGGSNFYGCAAAFLRDKLTGEHPETDVVGVEPRACPSITKGVYAWDYGDAVGAGPVAKMHTLGHTFVPHPIHAGGLRYHGAAPIVCLLANEGALRTTMHHQTEVIQAGVEWARGEGLVPAPETCHAVAEAKAQALQAKERGEKKVILFNFSGHGFFDLMAYEQYLAGKLEDYEYPDHEIQEALTHLPKVDESQFS
ncbi:MAG: TrpB-like pyridoxal phosphate-dependent enzyme [Promethearchaeota archaeon]